MSVPRWCDAALDAVLVLLASWTVTYHLSLLLDLSADTALVIVLGLLLPAAALWWLPRSRPQAASAVRAAGSGGADPAERSWRRAPSVLARVTAVLAVVAGLAMAANLSWPLVWIPFLLAAIAGVAAAALRWPDSPPGARTEPPSQPGSQPGRRPVASGRWGPEGAGTTAVVLGWASGLAVLSSVILRPNPDDLFYLNLSQWVAENGTFALRDTIFANLVYPIANWPPTASYDPLVGAVAYLLDARAGTVAYVVVPPLATFLAVLALWRLLRGWRARHVAVVLSVALVFLLLDGTSSYASPGNLFLTRLWQGKVVLLCVVVPLLLVHALAYVDRPSRRGAARLLLAGAAAVSLSTTALFLTPVLALAGVLPLGLARRWSAAAAGFAAAAAYPLAGAAATVALDGRSADDFGSRRLYRFDPQWFGHEIFLTGMVALVGVVAVLVGCLLIPHPAARVTTGALVLATGITLVPGLTWLSYDLVGLGPTLWRISWGSTVAALVGVLVVHLAATACSALARWRRVPVSALVAVAVGLAAVGGFGSPIWSGATASSFAEPLTWKRGDGTRSVAQWLLATSEPGDVVLAPNGLAITVAVTTTEVKTVAPRAYYMGYLRDVSSFRYPARLRLVRFADEGAVPPPAVLREDLDVLDVRTVCLYRADVLGQQALARQGWQTLLRTPGYRCLRR